MNAVRPPRLATWLLERLAPEARRESLIGDLHEHLARGRSEAWYWRQALTVIMVGSARELRANQRLGIRAAVFTWAAFVPWYYAAWAFYHWTFSWVLNWTRPWPILRTAWIFYGAPLLVVWGVGSWFTGWVWARGHHRHQGAMILACAAAQVPWALAWSGRLWRQAYWLAQHTRSAWSYAVPVGVEAIVILVGIPACALLGGLAVSGTLKGSSAAGTADPPSAPLNRTA
jgi:hypothetical protein